MADLLARRESAFVLWHVLHPNPPPRLIIGWLQPGTPLGLIGQQTFDLRPAAGFADLWEIPATECNLVEGWVYYYWFEVTSSRPGRPRICITDPLATTVDWRLLGPRLPPAFGSDERHPAAAIKWSGGRLVSADVGGELPSFFGEPLPDSLPANNRLVIYEVPAGWNRANANGARALSVGSFRDVTALIDSQTAGATFEDLEVTRPGRSYLADELGVNALQLHAPADANAFAPNFERGFPSTYSWPAPNRDLTELVRTCHTHRMRFIADMDLALPAEHPYLSAASPEAFSFARFVKTYDPVTGQDRIVSPARQLMKTMVDRWTRDFHIDGVRVAGLDPTLSWDFAQELREHARLRNRERYAALGLATQADSRFLVAGTEFSDPQALLERQQVDGLAHWGFKDYIRMALIGRNHEDEPSFETTVRRALDCRTFGYSDLSQAIICLTSRDLTGFRNERLFNFFMASGVEDAERRTKLAFACLLTAVGTPLILAGEEFAEPHELDFNHLGEDWRTRVKEYASRLIRLRTTYDALALNDIDFIHTDFEDGKRVLVWQRGQPGSDSRVIVVANFSDYATPNATEPDAEYAVPNWPQAPDGKRWREVPQSRWVEPGRAGREPIFAWEAKVYALQ